jgi:ketosteroid isomerase-like protein
MRFLQPGLRACACGLGLLATALLAASGSNLTAATSEATSEAAAGANSAATPIDQEVLAAREAAWRAYFAGDLQALGALLPEEFIGIGMNEAPFAGRAKTLEDARAFREKGGKLVRLAFPETRAQRFGDVVVLYGRFEVVLRSGGTEGTERTLRGRLTEVFVRRDGKWVHPGWHLDLTAAAPASSSSQ